MVTFGAICRHVTDELDWISRHVRYELIWLIFAIKLTVRRNRDKALGR
jgi:hypothetical protein